MSMTEETPLLWQVNGDNHSMSSRSRQPHYRSGQLNHIDAFGKRPHAQFCALTGCPPSTTSPNDRANVSKKSLYGRTITELRSQRRAYNASAALNNFMMLFQVVIGAALTALGASASSHIVIMWFGAVNTVIAGLTAYLRSRGQPMRARMYRDDLERVADEIENSEVMWRGISEGIHGYNDIDTDEVTVRSEVARLTRLYERAIRLNGMNNPDMYMAGAGGSDGNMQGASRTSRGGQAGASAAPQESALPAVTSPSAPQPSGENPGPAVPVGTTSDDVSPATKADVKDDNSDDHDHDHGDTDKKPSTDAPSNHDANMTAKASESKGNPRTPKLDFAKPAQPETSSAAPADNPDASPATAARLKPRRTRSDNERPDSHDRSRSRESRSDSRDRQ